MDAPRRCGTPCTPTLEVMSWDTGVVGDRTVGLGCHQDRFSDHRTARDPVVHLDDAESVCGIVDRLGLFTLRVHKTLDVVRVAASA